MCREERRGLACSVEGMARPAVSPLSVHTQLHCCCGCACFFWRCCLIVAAGPSLHWLLQEEYHAAIITCGEVLAEEPANAKALFRRGRARAALGQSEAAAGDLEKARAAAPEDGAIARELAAVRQALKQVRGRRSRRRSCWMICGQLCAVCCCRLHTGRACSAAAVCLPWRCLMSVALGAPRLPVQERQATGKMFQGYFDKAKDSLYEEQPPAAAAAAAAAGGGGQQQQALLQQRPGGALAAAAHSVWGLIMRGLRALLPFLF